MSLYGRLMGLEANKIPVHQFQATMAEYARGVISGAQAQDIISSVSAPLTPEEIVEAQTLLATFTGNATAKLARAKEVDDVLLLAEKQSPGYETVASVVTRLGV